MTEHFYKMKTKNFLITTLIFSTLAAAVQAEVVTTPTNTWEKGYNNKTTDLRPLGEKYEDKTGVARKEITPETRELRQDTRELKEDIKQEGREVRDNLRNGVDRATIATAEFETVTKGRDLIGMKVKNHLGETVGDIEDIALDMKTGRLNYLVLSSGGILGVRERYHAVATSAFRMGTEPKTLLLDVDKSALNNTPGFVKNHWPGEADRMFLNKVHSTAGKEVELRDPAGADVEIKTKTRVEDGVVKEREVEVDRK